MKSHVSNAVILCGILALFCVHAFAADRSPQESASSGGPAASSATQEGVLLVPMSASSTAGDGSQEQTLFLTVEGVSYLSVASVLAALFPEASLTQEAGTLTAAGPGLTLTATVDTAYFSVNGQYYYVPTLVAERGGALYLPAEALAQSLGCSAQTSGGHLTLSRTGPLPETPTYPEEDLYWLSRAIYAESGNQPMAGRIAVGSVILNRVEDPAFPDTIREVIFAPGQFSPVANGTIYRDPDAESVIAAKLCLDGVREAEDCLYFNVTSMVSWADHSRTYVCTIGDHNFYL